jgi:hypothetical protein
LQVRRGRKGKVGQRGIRYLDEEEVDRETLRMIDKFYYYVREVEVEEGRVWFDVWRKGSR